MVWAVTSTFFGRIADLREQVGSDRLEGHVVVDQIYAHYQHENVELQHPRGGQSHFLRDPLYADIDANMAELARAALTPTGSDLVRGMESVVEKLSGRVEELAPREFGDLERSGHPFVVHDGVTVFDRAPKVHRLTDAELRAKGREADAGLPGHTRNRSRLGPK